ncbi:endonuclease/exonuclease/phosphatase family protein [Shewanella psychropiezotolerans]|uniref:Endonuclease/exonuclease/phosphatase family protein n=1 Tax=Shewanella psychropiezotolerans TaxID=2593655 RepID=A0ABX5X1K7_9GAMM|nr:MULTISPECIES: endonuclease/exonuclease/phosphatase family protein [Shewanella]MPY21104.1 endonuclease/exonuclease/phosphatase family protein [Shewanella sp. YLB-07]MPY21891.1 endonuclease/exonuclease/phosphatase family protein [Shewanella sp. YLB-07]QDO85224.1 endonuclease/exonuclease/phosphatase family protein [Shewanella psychropiezotolerans]
MNFLKTAAAAAISIALLSGCNDETIINNPVEPTPDSTNVRFGTYNLSFDRSSFEQLAAEMALTTPEQEALMEKWFDETLTEDELKVAEKVIQIRNVAAIIQTERPAVLMMGEFNNDGMGENQDAIKGFRLNYLAVPQNGLGTTSDDKKMLEPIQFAYFENFSTNTGLLSEFDLDRNGTVALPGDAWGFGFYHGQYAFGLLSQYPIDTDNIRTFQTFKWKDMPGETNPTITNCEDENNPIPEGMKCGDEWYTAEAWAEKPLSSKNHVDAPILIPTADGEKVVHLLLSHPTPPVFDTLTQNNKMLNRAEIKFWSDYASNADYIYDDAGVKGGLGLDASFVVMGDLNADPENGDGFLDSIQNLMHHERVNVLATDGVYAPNSLGSTECVALGGCGDSTYPDRITSTFGLRVDHAIPSNDLNITDSGVFWPASFEDGYMLMNDERVGKWGNGKDISSDHRLVWIEAEL